MSSISNVQQHLRDQQNELAQRLATLQREHGEAALRAAEGDTDALKDVPAIMRQIEDIQEQQRTLNAAWSALKAREEAEARVAQIEEIKCAMEKLPALADDVRTRWTAFQEAIGAAQKAWSDFGDARIRMNKAASLPRRAAGRHRQSTSMPYDLDGATVNNLASGLIWGITEGEVVPRSSAEHDPEKVLDRVSSELENTIRHARNEAHFALSQLQK